tara:strand:+ start:734 stop:1561 length:828 start_codon:yes stop_codon:yes gene_type:complete
MPCGIDFNLSNLASIDIGDFGALKGLSGIIGTPAGLIAKVSIVTDTIANAEATLMGMIPAELGQLADLAQGGLRNQLGALADMVPGSSDALSKLGSIASEFTGISNLSGFANIDINNLANSVFSLSGSFDPCSIDIPNVFTDASGALQSLASSVPKIGSTDLAIDDGEISEMADGFMSSFTDNVDLGFGMGDFTSSIGDIGGSLSAFTDPLTGLSKSLSTADISNTLSNMASNISPSAGAMGDLIQKLPDGSQIMQTKDALIDEVQSRTNLFTEV